MSAASLYRIDFDDISTGKRADSITTAAASEDAARRYADDVMRKSPHLRLVGIYHATATSAGRGTAAATGVAIHSATATAVGIGAAAATGEVVRQYDADILLWSERQAELLRRRAAGELVNDTELDWPNIAEEIEDVGRSQLHAVEGLLIQALLHMLKAEAWPLTRDAPSWRADARLFRRQARRRFVPSMRQRIDLASLYADALAGLPDTMDGQAPLPVPDACPVTLGELLAEP